MPRIALVLFALCTGCTAFAIGFGTRPGGGSGGRATVSPVYTRALAAYALYTRDGNIEGAIVAARAVLADAQRAPPDLQGLLMARQILGLVLAAGGQADEAAQHAAQIKQVSGTVSWLAIDATLATEACQFDRAAALYLELRHRSPGMNDAPTEAALAAIDRLEGRLQRALDRLEHAWALPRPASMTEELFTHLQELMRRQMVTLKLNLGGRAFALADALTEQTRIFGAARHLGAYALQHGRALHAAYHAQVDAVLLAIHLKNATELSAARARLARIVSRYATDGGACKRVVRDLLATEMPGTRTRLVPATPPASSPSTSHAPVPTPMPVVADRDHDGIPDERDKCPDEPEVYNGVDDEDGCPDQAPGYLAGREIRLNEKIPFAHDSHVIRPRGHKVLDWLADFLKKTPRIALASIEGHTDDVGAPSYNLDLSRRRAQAVRLALVARGVAPARLRATGLGDSRPIVLGKDSRARATNRRVEIIAQQIAP